MNFSLVSGSSHPEFSKKLAHLLGKELFPLTKKEFARGEFSFQFDTPLPEKTVLIIQTLRPNFLTHDLWELLLLSDTIKRAGAREIYAVIPHFSCVRPDKKRKSRFESVSASLWSRLLKESGVNGVFTTESFTQNIPELFSLPVYTVPYFSILENRIRNLSLSSPVIIAQNYKDLSLSLDMAEILHYPLAVLPHADISRNLPEDIDILGNIENMTPLFIQEIIDTAGTVCSAKKHIVDHGAKDEAYLIGVHGLFSGPAEERIRHTQFHKIITTDSIPKSLGSEMEYEQISFVSEFAKCIQEVL
jgi:ribose-phosphate pyrophosphokinase